MKKLLILLLLMCSLSAGTYERGAKAFKNKDYTKAYRLLSKSAKNNNIKAQLLIGGMYLYGWGMKADHEKASYWYKKALNRKSRITKRKNTKKWMKEDFRKLATIYEGRSGGIKNYIEAEYWYKKAAMLGDAFSQYFLGEIYNYGQGKVEKDNKKAYKWYIKAARQGYDLAKARVAYMYYIGEGVPVNRSKADYWLKRISKKDSELSEQVLSWVKREKLFEKGSQYYNGTGVQKNPKKAFELFEKAAGMGHSISQFNTGAMYLNGEGVTIDRKKAVEWLGKSAEQGHEGAIVTLEMISQKPSAYGIQPSVLELIKNRNKNGVTHAQEKEKQNQPTPKKSNNPISKLEKDAANGDTTAQYDLAKAYYTGKGMVTDMKKAFYWFKKAAESGHALAQDMLGWFYFDGKSIHKDMSKAIYWYTKSAVQNNHSAQQTLGWIYLFKAVPVNYEKSIEYFTQAIKGNPSATDAHFLRAYAYEEIKQYRNAIRDYEIEINKNPKEYAALNNLAAIYATADNPNIVDAKKAIALITRANNIKQDLYTLSVFAAAYARDGQYAKAVSFSEQAMKLMKKDSKAYEDEQEAIGQYRAGKPYTKY